MGESKLLRIRLRSESDLDLAIEDDGSWQEIDESVPIADVLGMHSALTKLRECANAIPGLQNLSEGGIYEIEIVLEDEEPFDHEGSLPIGFGVPEGVRPPRGDISGEEMTDSGSDMVKPETDLNGSDVLCPHCKRKIRIVSGES